MFFSLLWGDGMPEKKIKVIDVARSLFSKYGYKKVTMDEIAKKSGVTKKTIYTYFKDKDDLIKYFVLEKISNIKKIIIDIQNKDLPIEKKAHEVIYAVLNYQSEDKLLDSLRAEAKDMPLGVAKKWYDFINEEVLLEIKTIVTEAIENKMIKDYDVELLSFIIYKVYFALVFERKTKLKDKEIDKIIDFLNYGLFRGDNNE